MTSDDKKIEELVGILRGFKPGRPLKGYITHAVFPKFKNIEPFTRVDFQFPLTALVGANGIGKSSLLHALWGMPYGYSTSKFWFSTELDPIENNKKNPQRYFYGHWHDEYGDVVETRKARLGTKRDYWEPYRRSAKDGMQPIPDGNYKGKAKDRWNPVRRKVVYINFRALFGSFDRYFYFDDDFGDGNKRDIMLNAARRLKTVKEKNKESYKLGRKERIFENRFLTPEELSAASEILGRVYDSAQIIRHSLFPGNRGRDLSVVFKRGSEYTEAFAGSGEIAAVSAVVDVLDADAYSLILLDEPETSLHPGAQRALLRFLLEQIKIKKHQVVMSTHSPEFLAGLPHEAIKVFEDNGKSQARVIPKSSPDAALNRLGRPPANMRRLLVEDFLAQQIVLRAAKLLDKGDREALEIKVAPGGADAILKHLGPAAMVSGDNVFLLLDGDKKKVSKLTDPNEIPPSDYSCLTDLLKKQIGVDPQFHIPGGDDQAAHEEAKVLAQLEYLRWLSTHLEYLPKKMPEQIVLDQFAISSYDNESRPHEIKTAFRELLADGAELDLSSAELDALARVKVDKIPLDNADLAKIYDSLIKWLHG